MHDVDRPTENEPNRVTVNVLWEIGAERARQMLSEGWTPEHDDGHDAGEMARAASAYVLHAEPTTEFKLAPVMTETGVRSEDDPRYIQTGHRSVPKIWPWQGQWWKPKDRRSDLVRAGALLVAEIE